MMKKKTRERRIAAGICTRCGKAPASPGYTKCDACRQKAAAYAAAQRKSLAAAGRCTRCGQRLQVNGFLRCESCRKKTAKESQSYYWNRWRQIREQKASG